MLPRLVEEGVRRGRVGKKRLGKGDRKGKGRGVREEESEIGRG